MDSVVHVVKYKISWGSSTTIIKECFEVVVKVTSIDKANVLVESKLNFAAGHETDNKQAEGNGKNYNLAEFVENQRNEIFSKEGSYPFFSRGLFFACFNAEEDINPVLLNTLAVKA